MRDQHEEDPRDQDEIEIEDLGAPTRGINRYVFNLGEKWRTVAPLRARIVTSLLALALLIAVLLPGASGANTRTSGAPHAAPANSSPSTIYLIDCGMTVNVNSLPSQVYVWEQVVSTPAAQECNFFRHPASKCPTPQQLLSTPPPIGQGVVWTCNAGTPFPGPAGKNGRNR
jgi:hypothetical protein